MLAAPRFRAGFACVCKASVNDVTSIRAFALDVMTICATNSQSAESICAALTEVRKM